MKIKHKGVIALLFLMAAIIMLAACTTQPTGKVVQQVPSTIPAPAQAIPSISLKAYPDVANAGDMARIMWRLDSSSPITATHTAIHYDTKSHPGAYDLDVGPAQGGYAGLTPEYSSGTFAIPGDFATQIKIPEGATQLYFRAHAIVNGKNYWTGEQSIKINSKAPAPVLPVVTTTTINPAAKPIAKSGVPVNIADYTQFTVRADDASIDPVITTVNTNQLVALTFEVKSTNVASGALQFNVLTYNSFWGSSKDVLAGAEQTMYFQAPDQPRVVEYGVYSAGGGSLMQLGYIDVVAAGTAPRAPSTVISSASSGGGSGGGSSMGGGY